MKGRTRRRKEVIMQIFGDVGQEKAHITKQVEAAIGEQVTFRTDGKSGAVFLFPVEEVFGTRQLVLAPGGEKPLTVLGGKPRKKYPYAAYSTALDDFAIAASHPIIIIAL
jgi:hypothetical protein